MGRGIGLLSLLDRMEGESALTSKSLDAYIWCVVGRNRIKVLPGYILPKGCRRIEVPGRIVPEACRSNGT
jgi:hypothetical protein